MNKNDATISVGANTTAFTTEMAGLEKGLVAQMDRIGKVFMGAMGIGAAARGIASAFSGLTGPAAELENVSASLGVLLGNESEADKLARGLRDIAINGVIGFEDLHRAARPLSNVFSDADSIERWVGVFADIGAATKIPVERLAAMVSRVEDMGQARFAELANAGIPIFETLSEVLGVSREEVVRLAQQGGISSAELLEAFRRLTAEGGKFHAMNETLSNTTKGSWDTLRASVEACKAELGEPINDAFRPLLQGLSGYLQENRERVREFAGAFAGVFESLAGVGRAIGGVLEPVVGVVGGMSESLGGLGTAAVVCVSGLAAYGAMTSKAGVSTVGFGAAVRRAGVYVRNSYRDLSVVARYGNIWKSTWLSMAQATRAGATGIRVGMGGLFAGVKGGFARACVGMRLTWSMTMTGLVVATKTACTAIKAALISTGIGALVWLLGEGLSAVVGLFMDAEGEAEAAAAATKHFADELKALDKRQGGLKTREEADEFKGELEERRVELQQELNKAQEEGNDALAEATQKQLEAIRERIALQESEVPARLAAVEAEERRAAALEASVDAEKKVLELYNAASAERRAQEISGMELGAQEGELLRDMGFSSFAQIQEGIEDVFRRVSLGQATEAEVERMRELLELRKRVEAVRVKMAEAEKKEAEELAAKEKERLETERQARENYAARRLTYNRNREQAEHERLDIGAQEKGLREEAVRFGVVGDVSPESIRARLDALAEAGAKSNEREIAALERLLESWDKLTERKEAYAKLRGQNAAELRISALEAAGNQEAADKLREQLAVSRRVQELQAAGASEAEAKSQAEAESKVRQAQALQEKIQNRRVEWLQGSQAAVGGGGLSMRLGGGQLAESKRHTKLMQEILTFMKSSANKQQAGAVLA